MQKRFNPKITRINSRKKAQKAQNNIRKGGDIMPISIEYAVLSKDEAAIILPKDVQ